jgi:SMC interacting uncharacterized protein involved in chromosome segregation
VHVSEASFNSLKFEEDEFKSKLQQSERVISSFKKQPQANDGLTETMESLNQTARGLCEKQKQLQATIDGLSKTVEALNQTVKMLCGKPQDVSTYKLHAVTLNKLTEIPPVINTAKLQPYTVVW